MNKKSKNGFTLVELLAVIVILALIVILAITTIGDRVEKSNANALKVNANKYVKAVNDMASMSIRESVKYDNGFYQISDIPADSLKISGTLPDSGFVEIADFEVIDACLIYRNYVVTFENGEAKDVVEDGKCVPSNITFAYTGSPETYEVPKTGVYKVEAWGAQGGSSNVYSGGYGGYSVGSIYLTKGENLYINVGGAGKSNCVTNSCAGGYNGGGSSVPYTNDQNNTVSGGGGATSISFKTGLLSSLSNNRDKIIMVAGGGGGAYQHINGNPDSANGGNGGGYFGTSQCNTNSSYTCAGYGTQVSGGGAGTNGTAGTFGTGATSTQYSSGGGAGYYGGGSAAHKGTGGGSGFIGNYRLYNKSMYCYNCTQSTVPGFKTVSSSCSKAEATSNCSKQGDGFVRITYLSADEPASNIKYLYSNGNEFTDITGGWKAVNEQGNGRTEKLSDNLHVYCSTTGSSGSYFVTNNAIDMTGYTKLNVDYQIVSQLTSNDYAKLRVHGTNFYLTSSNIAAGYYHDEVDITNVDSSKVTLQNWDTNDKIFQVYLTK